MTKKEIKCCKKKCKKCPGNYVITACDIGKRGYVIRKPGVYTICGDITFDPESPVDYDKVIFSGGGGSGATGFAAVSDGMVRGVFVTNAGTGYTSPPSVSFPCHGSGASGSVTLQVMSISITDPGTNYTNPTVVITGDGSGATAVVSSQDGSGGITGITITYPGTGYTNATVSITDPTGTGFSGSVIFSVESVTITSPGFGYRNTVQAAITIESSNVVLKFKSHTLTQKGFSLGANVPPYTGANVPSSQAPFVIGVYIPDLLPNGTPDQINQVALESIYIEGDKGGINGFSMAGIYCLGHTMDIRIENLTVDNSGVLASYYLRPFPTYLPNDTNLLPIPGAVSFTVAGIVIGESSIFGLGPNFFTANVGVLQNRVQDVVMKNVDVLNSFDFGVIMTSVTNTSMRTCNIANTFNDDPFAFFGVIGIFAGTGFDYESPGLVDFYANECNFINTQNRGDGQQAFYLITTNAYFTKSEDLVFKDCHYDHAITTFLTYDFPGYYPGSLNSALVNATWENCTFNDIMSTSFTQGFHHSGRSFENTITSGHNCRLINCQASNVQTSSPLIEVQSGTLVNGFAIYYEKNVLFENCTASNIISNVPSDADGHVEGFYIGDGKESNPDFETQNLVFRNCVAQRILATQGGNASGFRFETYEGPGYTISTVEVKNCIAQGCQSLIPTLDVGTVQGTGKGFAYDNYNGSDTAFPLSFSNCIAMNNQGAPVVTLSVTHYSGGFVITSTDNVITGVNFYKCYAVGNVYGFLLSNDQLCTVRDCQSDNNVANSTNDSTIDGIVGGGFIDLGLGTTGTPVAPAPSKSLFEKNTAFANGVKTVHFGTNGNYYIIYITAPIPLLEGDLTVNLVPKPVPLTAFKIGTQIIIPPTTNVSTIFS